MSLESAPSETHGQWNWYKQAMRNPSNWLKLFKGKVSISHILGTAWKKLSLILDAKTRNLKPGTVSETLTRDQIKNLSADLCELTDNNTHLTFLLATNEPGYDILMTGAARSVKKLIAQHKISMTMIENADHTFSKYKPRCEVSNLFIQHLRSRYQQ